MAKTESSACSRIALPDTDTKAFGSDLPSLLPVPAATTMTATVETSLPPLGGKNLVENGRGLLFVGLLRQGEF